MGLYRDIYQNGNPSLVGGQRKFQCPVGLYRDIYTLDYKLGRLSRTRETSFSAPWGFIGISTKLKEATADKEPESESEFQCPVGLILDHHQAGGEKLV